MEYEIKQVRLAMPINAFKTATVDRGKEFACYSSVEKDLDIKVFLLIHILHGKEAVMKIPMD